MQGHRDIGDHVILVHGDLATGERINALQRSRSEEKTSWRRYQHVIFVMGLFHLKMACAEAVWKLCTIPKATRADKTCLMAEVAAIRPKETRKVISKPGFCRMHEIIQHVGIVSQLDCWRVEVKRRYLVNSLENWAKTKPIWEILKDIAKTLVKDHVAEPRERRDEQRENAMVRQQLYMYYKEISGAMNAGDIGCVEQCFLPWILVFKGCGKHKYATHMLRILHNLYFVYPAGLRRAIRMNWLCNPTGQYNAFRGVDWWLEHNNLYTKRIYAGLYSTRTQERIIKESPLIQSYKRVRITFEDMFMLQQRSYTHSGPAMERTFRRLAKLMEELETHEHKPGRSAKYTMPNLINSGLAKLGSVGSELVDMDDVVAEEVDGEDGDLDV
ncbi:hypothetical protein CERSUDRAFT_65102 [Gelatoporia subvermispora B]|uniref:DUF6589 domain-containing protein n=1 Tax=Ceriporiopsis subvermispora (strain B) TaxID=914234 RepID=M2PM34_CERS8|nr:hypothetical protein CERSUDRAFT_65102 [Gelatoporia subvermispora B]